MGGGAGPWLYPGPSREPGNGVMEERTSALPKQTAGACHSPALQCQEPPKPTLDPPRPCRRVPVEPGSGCRGALPAQRAAVCRAAQPQAHLPVCCPRLFCLPAPPLLPVSSGLACAGRAAAGEGAEHGCWPTPRSLPSAITPQRLPFSPSFPQQPLPFVPIPVRPTHCPASAPSLSAGGNTPYCGSWAWVAAWPPCLRPRWAPSWLPASCRRYTRPCACSLQASRPCLVRFEALVCTSARPAGFHHLLCTALPCPACHRSCCAACSPLRVGCATPTGLPTFGRSTPRQTRC